jgi:hypothetical protein
LTIAIDAASMIVVTALAHQVVTGELASRVPVAGTDLITSPVGQRADGLAG